MFALYSSNGCQLQLFFAFFVNKKESLQFRKCVILSLFCVLSDLFCWTSEIIWQTYWSRGEKIQLLYLVFLIFDEGICGTLPFTKWRSFLRCAFRIPQFFFNKSAFLKSQDLRTCVLKNVCLDNVGLNSYIFTFWAKKTHYLVKNVGLNLLIIGRIELVNF